MLGSFLELSIRTPDIIESLGFYRGLGFEEQVIGDVWSHRYAVVSDGDVCIGLHDRVFDSPTLTFVQQDLASHARRMADTGLDFSFLNLEDDVFNEAGFVDRDGHTVGMLEARTFTPADQDTSDSVCGRFFELSLPVRDAMCAGRFWAPLVTNLLELREGPTTHMRLEAAGMPVGFSESTVLTRPSLCFRCNDRAGLHAFIEEQELEYESNPGFEGAFVELRAPEGTSLFAFDEDFLGESYLVSEEAS